MGLVVVTRVERCMVSNLATGTQFLITMLIWSVSGRQVIWKRFGDSTGCESTSYSLTAVLNYLQVSI